MGRIDSGLKTIIGSSMVVQYFSVHTQEAEGWRVVKLMPYWAT